MSSLRLKNDNLLKWQIFFVRRSKDNMAQQMDQMCTTIVIVIVVILICMGCVEMSKMRTRYNMTSGACGRKSEVEDLRPKISAKEGSVTGSAKPYEPNLDLNTSAGMNTEDTWDLEVSASACKHEEFNQNNEEIMQNSFNVWQASAEDTAKFVPPDKDQIKKNANARSMSIDTQMQEPTMSRTTGITNALLSFRDKHSATSNKRTFSDNCPQWGTSEAHYAARNADNKSCGY